MGNSSNRPEQFQLQNWTECSDPGSSLFPQVNTFRTRLLFNSITQHYIQEYNLHFISWQEYQTYLGEIQWRREGSTLTPPIQVYPVKYFRDCSSSELCSTIYAGAVYFERIEMRLKEINDIPFTDAIYVMRTCLQGFGTLYKSYGAFDVREEMVFICEAGTAKVWLNSNLSLNVPHHRDSTQTSMVTTIITMIQSNIDPDYQGYEYFSDYLKKTEQYDDVSFEEALHELNTFCIDRKLIIPTFMKSVADLYTGEGRGGTQQSMFESHGVKMMKSAGEASVRKLEFQEKKKRMPLDQYQFTKKHGHKPTNHSSPEQGHKHPRSRGQTDEEYSVRGRTNRMRANQGTKPLTPNTRVRGKVKGAVASEYFRPESLISQQGRNSAKIKLQNKYSQNSKVHQKQTFLMEESSSLTTSKRLGSAEPRSLQATLPVPINQAHQLPNKDPGRSSKVRFNYMPTVSELSSPRNLTPSTMSYKNKSAIVYSKNFVQMSFKPENNLNFQSRTTNITQNNNIEENSKKYFTTSNSYQLDPEIAADLQKILKEEKI